MFYVLENTFLLYIIKLITPIYSKYLYKKEKEWKKEVWETDLSKEKEELITPREHAGKVIDDDLSTYSVQLMIIHEW